MELYKEVGKLIAKYRKDKGISQEKLAALSDLHEDYIGKIERGERKVTLHKLNDIIKSLGITFKEFFNNFD
ncbi:helix-turn-helix transcriptional regulator [Marivirga tractuosa]|uniref:helix-turn-helix domain-containing protein n=1 Tax=Marivirga tractuosa TaxID=1006 RepID=UPI0035CFCD5F